MTFGRLFLLTGYDNGEFSPSFFMANWITKQRRIFFSIIIATTQASAETDMQTQKKGGSEGN